MIKAAIKKQLTQKRDDAYKRELKARSNSYAIWYREHKHELSRSMGAKDHTAADAFTVEAVKYSHLRNYILSGKQMPDIIIAHDDDGTLTDYAEQLIRDFFAENPRIGLVYGDEDRIDEDGELRDFWFKPDWSPDTFLSTFYFGSVFAFRSSELAMINPGGRSAEDIEPRSRIETDREEEVKAARSDLDVAQRSWIYGKLVMKLAQAAGGFTRRHKGRFPIGHISEVLFHASKRPEPWDSDLIKTSLTGRYSAESASGRLVSIIIPSKDNPQVLATCIRSIELHTQSPYELIVVDNGSTPENRRKVEAVLEKHNETGSAQYIYEPMPFNFSRMCNIGASYANGELLLFLNDDIEICRPMWLAYLSEKAKLPYVGAVGMKLLYPGSEIIQHAGVINVHAGPIHKLQYCDNREVHYFGFNKGVRNVIAVTGACLMVRTSLFQEVGGFDEENYAVAFNDIDLCLKIFEKGYYNVVRNNMYLYHHESLSRGDDRKDEIKAQRLSREQGALLSSHPDLFARDPFYHDYLVQDPAVTGFEIAVEDVELRNPHYAEPVRHKGTIPVKWEDPVLRLGVEFANSLDKWLTGPLTGAGDSINSGYYIKGYSFVINADNAIYDRKILLRQEGTADPVYEVDVENALRLDIAENLTDQINDKLTGFGAVIRKDALPSGSWQVGMLAIDKTGRQRIVNWSDVKLVIQ